MPNGYRILGGKRIPGTVDYAVAAIGAACTISDPSDNERSWRIARTIGRQPPAPGKRVWYRIPSDGLGDSYISVWPGAYRTARPTDAEDLILELPEADPEDTIAFRVASLLEHLRSNHLEKREANCVEMLLQSTI
jgi:hypothetical protein